MGTSKPVLTITKEEWQSRQIRGLVAVIRDRRYLVMTHEVTREPVYQPVAILQAGAPDGHPGPHFAPALSGARGAVAMPMP